MASDLFDPLLELAVKVAKQGKKAKPRQAPPARLEPMLRFAKLPDKAKDVVLEVIDSDDEFRGRVAEKATEKLVGRVGMMFLERPEGWDEFIEKMVTASEEPIIESTSAVRKAQKQLESVEQARDRAVQAAAEESRRVAELESEVATATSEAEALKREVSTLSNSNKDLLEQRQRAVSELKRTEEIMARHIGERKRLESTIEQMTSAQLSTTTVGGAVTDVEVRAVVDVIEGSIEEVQAQLNSLRRAATAERVPAARRTPLPVPHGLLDDSVEFAEYLLSVPNITVLVDGYNVTKLERDELDLEHQRTWLEQGLRSLSARFGATFDVVFDGADISSASSGRDHGVRVRFSPAGVEADDVIIDAVAASDRSRPVAVVSSDNRVRAGAADGGANVLHSKQLIALLS